MRATCTTWVCCKFHVYYINGTSKSKAWTRRSTWWRRDACLFPPASFGSILFPFLSTRSPSSLPPFMTTDTSNKTWLHIHVMFRLELFLSDMMEQDITYMMKWWSGRRSWRKSWWRKEGRKGSHMHMQHIILFSSPKYKI